jgi:hypothetical protein
MYFDRRFSKYINPFHKQRFTLRTLIRHHKRLHKELTRSVNRLRQHLYHLFPEENFHNYSRYKLFKGLDTIEKNLFSHPDTISVVTVSEVKAIKNSLESLTRTDGEIESIVKNHKDYFILKSFGLGTLQIATLIAYYWDIELFKDKDSFIAYCLMGVKKEQSGKSVNRTRTDKTRTEIKGMLYLFFLKCHREDSPLRPLVEYMKIRESEHRSRYIKFLDKLFELIYYALKERKTFEEIIEKGIEERKAQLSNLESKIYSREAKENPEYYRRLLERYRNTSDLLLVCKDISTAIKRNRQSAEAVECQDYYKEDLRGLYKPIYQENSNENNQRRVTKRTSGETSKEAPAEKNKKGVRSNNRRIPEPDICPYQDRERGINQRIRKLAND